MKKYATNNIASLCFHVYSHCSRDFTSPNTQENVTKDDNAGLSGHFHLTVSYFSGKATTLKARILSPIPSQSDQTFKWD